MGAVGLSPAGLRPQDQRILRIAVASQENAVAETIPTVGVVQSPGPKVLDAYPSMGQEKLVRFLFRPNIVNESKE